MITEGEAAIPLETTLHAFCNQEKTKQRSTIDKSTSVGSSDRNLGLDIIEIMTISPNWMELNSHKSHNLLITSASEA